MFHVSDHPLIAIKLTQLRLQEEKPPRTVDILNCGEYSAIIRQITMLLAYEVLSDLTTYTVTFDTQQRGKAVGKCITNCKFVLVPILRSGLVMHQVFQELLPDAHTGHIGIHRTKGASKRKEIDYLVSLPEPTPQKIFILLDPVIAEGVTATKAIIALKDAGATDDNIRFVCLISSSYGRSLIDNRFPGVQVYCAAEDYMIDVSSENPRPGLNDLGQLLPGLGSISSHLFGYKTTSGKV